MSQGRGNVAYMTERERKETVPRIRVPVADDVPPAISDRVLVYDSASHAVCAAIITRVVDEKNGVIHATLFPDGEAPLPVASQIIPRNRIIAGVIPARYTWAWPPLRRKRRERRFDPRVDPE
jgi:hypothetical protein